MQMYARLSTSEQQSRIDYVNRFAKEVLSVFSKERVPESSFDRKIWRQAAEFGLTGLPIPEEMGGSGLGAMDTMLIVEALGNGCTDMGLVFSLCAHMFACAIPVLRFGSSEQQATYLKPMSEGDIIAANAITEPDSGSDAFAMRTTARRNGDNYILNGEKCFVTNAPIADVFLIYAKTNSKLGYFGISAFLIPTDTEGMKIVSEGEKTGLKTSPWGSVYFDECIIPVSALLGEEGGGATIFHDSMIWERGCLFAAYVGAMQRVLDQCIEHVKERKQFGKRICENQAISNNLVDMKIRLETSRLLLYRAGGLFDSGENYEEAIAHSKLWISECAVQNGLDAIQIFGAAGVIREMGIDSLLLDALPAKIFSGTSEIQRETIARHMGLR